MAEPHPWFEIHSAVEVVSRDRAGIYADAARQGAPQARQVADRFHLLQNFRETVERQLGRFEAPISDPLVEDRDDQATPSPSIPATSACPSDTVAQERLKRRGRQAERQDLFDEIRALFESGSSVREIARKLGLGRTLGSPHRFAGPQQDGSKALYAGILRLILLARRWDEGITKVRHLFAEICHRGYTGSYSHLARFLAPWRTRKPSPTGDEQVCTEQEEPAPARVRMVDPMTGRVISPLIAAALCVKPRGQMTARQVANVDALEAGSAEFTAMRKLAMRFRGLLRGGTTEKLDSWLDDARASGICGMQRFARTIRQDLQAVRNAVLEPWSNGQTEGQINKLKTLKRAMYGRAGVDLLRARMMPLQDDSVHQK